MNLASARTTLFAIVSLAFAFLTCETARPTDWVRAGLTTNEPVWGVRGGLLWAIPPGGSGPRGLIRVYYPVGTNGAYDLINFIAIEPVVHGNRGLSELEQSQLDDSPGKRLWALGESDSANEASGSGLVGGRLSTPALGVEQLEVGLAVEPFANGAQVRLMASQRSDAPDELRLAVSTHAGSAPLDYCILTATMGNKARNRLLWLKDETVCSLKLFHGHTGDGFTPHRGYALDRLARTAAGGVLVAMTTDEENPAAVFPFPGTQHWYYGGYKVTQYWKKSSGTFRHDLQAIVNARYTYWRSQQPIPGGVAFENFELQERFYQGQAFVFGITRRTPAQLGIGGPKIGR